MWFKWFPWRFLIRQAAKKSGFIDPVSLLANFDRFAEPSEVRAPTELLRAGIVMQARGFINNQAIQHNLDWVWPYWVCQQFDPKSTSFIPRAFSVSHINITHRNWTAIGVPQCNYMPIVDPRGLVTPHHDGWSLDFWIVGRDRTFLVPSRLPEVNQELLTSSNLFVTTKSDTDTKHLSVKCMVEIINNQPFCNIDIQAVSANSGYLAVSVRPFNPEGVSFIDSIGIGHDTRELVINKKDRCLFLQVPEKVLFSTYSEGDVFEQVQNADQIPRTSITCPVGMATCAALFPLDAMSARSVNIAVPLTPTPGTVPNSIFLSVNKHQDLWSLRMKGACTLQIPDTKIVKLFTTALTTLVLHTPGNIFAGPYIYKRFWFRDAALILEPMLVLGVGDNFLDLVKLFFKRQRQDGYFLSQEGEWDSNGQVLWLLNQYRILTHTHLDPLWRKRIVRAANWIQRKRRSSKYAGLMPAGFSAEHLGPNDNYYWDDFWSVAGLTAASEILLDFGDKEMAEIYKKESDDLLKAIMISLDMVASRQGHKVMPSSPHRRMDSAAVASLAASYPLQILAPDDPFVRNTVDFLFNNNFVNGALFHDISHSGINPYLTLHIAQAMLRAGDPRFLHIMYRIRDLASPTGQWPEGIHPQTGYGCMGDGEHVWAAAEWAMMVRNCFVRDELTSVKIVLCSGIAREWLTIHTPITFGPTHTAFGTVSVMVTTERDKVRVSWKGIWHDKCPLIEVSLPGTPTSIASPDKDWIDIQLQNREVGS